MYQINVFLGIHKPGKSKKYTPEFMQSGSYFDAASNVCEIGVMQLIGEPDGFYCDSIQDLMNFSQVRSDGREEAAKQGLLDLESDDLPSDEAQKIIDEYEDNAVDYAKDTIGSMALKSLTVDGNVFKIEWS